VRDLASGCQLLWQPLRAANAEAVVHALALLCAWHGAPLVLKSDNGFAFAAEVTRTLLHQAGVIILFSPPYWPRYNGAIEAGILMALPLGEGPFALRALVVRAASFSRLRQRSTIGRRRLKRAHEE
jgi:hypothetical protein